MDPSIITVFKDDSIVTVEEISCHADVVCVFPTLPNTVKGSVARAIVTDHTKSLISPRLFRTSISPRREGVVPSRRMSSKNKVLDENE